MKRTGKFLLFAVFGLVVVASAILLVMHRRDELAEKTPPSVRPVPVHTAQAEHGRLPMTEHYIGKVEPMRYADLSPRATGHIASVAGDIGDSVQKGETAVVVDARLPQRNKAAVAAELKGAEAALAISRKIYDRRKELLRKGHTSEERLDETKRQYILDNARVKRLEQEFAAADISLRYTRLKAPFDGIITHRMKDPGDLAAPGTPVLRVEKPAAGYKLLVHIPQATAEQLKPGDAVILNFKANSREEMIDRIQPAIDPGALATAEIRLNARPFGLPSGATVGVDVVINRLEGTIIPLSCLLEQENSFNVFTVSSNRNIARAIPIKLLGRSGSRAVVEGDIPEGAKLISGNESMLIKLADNTPVQPIVAEDL